MTTLPPDDGRLICRIQLTGEGRCVSLAISLGDLVPAGRFLTISDRLSCDLVGINPAARESKVVP
jgi:hypothetical protein